MKNNFDYIPPAGTGFSPAVQLILKKIKEKIDRDKNKRKNDKELKRNYH